MKFLRIHWNNQESCGQARKFGQSKFNLLSWLSPIEIIPEKEGKKHSFVY